MSHFGTTTQQRISRWLTPLLYGPGSGPWMILLSHASLDQALRLLRTWKVDAAPGREQEFDELVQAIDQQGAADAEELGGMQRYIVRAQARGRDIGSLTLRYNLGPGPAEVAGADSEPASARGLVAQAQRHAEVSTRMLHQGFGSIVESQERRLAKQDEIIERLEQQHLAVISLQEGLLSQQHERDLAAAREESNLQTRQHFLGMMKPLVPVILNRLLGSGVLTAASPRNALVDGLVGSITPEQFAGLASVLAPAQLAALKELIEGAAGEEEESPATPAGSGPVPTDAGERAGSGAGKEFVPLDGAAKAGAAMLLKQRLLPLLVERQRAGKPLFDPGADDWSLFLLVKRLVRSSTAEELDFVLAGLEPAEQDAVAALAKLLNVAPRHRTASEARA
jgi:hypothetical protein